MLHAPRQLPVAVDLETRLHETGLASVQIADYRNFAHGRHFGFARHLDETTVISLSVPESAALERATLAVLPARSDILRLASGLQWPWSTPDLIVAAIRTVDLTAALKGTNLARPGVSSFGRRLYHLRTSQELAPGRLRPVYRKLGRIGVLRPPRQILERYQDALTDWLATTRGTRLGGLVLDYDGTCCDNHLRREPIAADLQVELVRLLRAGVLLGFASGRGPSLYKTLRSWVPKRFHRSVILGLYNGSLVLRLDEMPPDQHSSTSVLRAFEERISHGVLGGAIQVSARSSQATFEVSTSLPLGGRAMATVADELIGRDPKLPLRTVVSAHSADVVVQSSSKVAVLDRLRTLSGDEVLVVGDQGQVGGNDFELLASTVLSLTVDRCSSDPTRCWNLDSTGLTGPRLLHAYLRATQRSRSGVRFRPELP